MSELLSLWSCLLRGTVTPLSSSAKEGAFSSSYHLKCKCVCPPPTEAHTYLLPSADSASSSHISNVGELTQCLWHTPRFSPPAAVPAALARKSLRQEGTRIILGVNSVWRKCGQGDSGRRKSRQSVCLSVCLCDWPWRDLRTSGRLCSTSHCGILLATLPGFHHWCCNCQWMSCLRLITYILITYIHVYMCVYVSTYLCTYMCMCGPKHLTYLQDRDLVDWLLRLTALICNVSFLLSYMT